MRILYDSIQPSAIPTNAPLVGGYVDGRYRWASSDWNRFSGVKVRIAVFPGTNDGQVGDVETGDMTPASSVSWVRMRRAAGVDPTLYCNLSTYPNVEGAFRAAGVPQPHYWIADYSVPGSLSLAPGQVAHQYADSKMSGGNYDLSITADYWPGVDTRLDPKDGIVQEVRAELRDIRSMLADGLRTGVTFDGNGNPTWVPEPTWPYSGRDQFATVLNGLADLKTAMGNLQVPPANLQPLTDAINRIEAALKAA